MEKKNNEINKTNEQIKISFWTFIKKTFMVAVVILVILQCYTIVPAGNEGLMFSSISGVKNEVLSEGLHFKKPFIEDIIVMNVQTQKLDRTLASTSKDQQVVNAIIVVNYHVNAAEVNKLYQEIGINYADKVITPAADSSIKFAMAQFDAPDLINKRDLVSALALEELRKKVENRYVTIDSVNIINLDFSQEFNHAIEAKVVAQQQQQKAQNDLERIKIEAQQTVVQANATAQAKLSVATAEAQAIKLQQDSLQNSPEVLQLRWIEKWNGQLPTITSSNNPNLLMSIDSLKK